MHIFYHTLNKKDINRLDQLQYKAAKLVSGALHYTSKCKLEKELGWETIQSRAEMLGLSMFYKTHHNLTRPLIRTCLTDHDNNLYDLRNNGNKRLLYPNLGNKYRKSFFPHFTVLWNNLPQEVRRYDLVKFKEFLHYKYKPNKFKFYYYGTKYGNKLITRIRVGQSYLNSHAYSIGHTDSPNCHCGSNIETPQHILLECNKYCSERQIMLDRVVSQISRFNNFSKKDKTHILLYGYKSDDRDYHIHNINITLAVQKFLLNIKRF